MVATELIDPMLPVLKPTDTVGQAIDWMQEHRLSQLVLADEGAYQGLLTEDVLMDAADDGREVGNVMHLYEQVYVYENQHIFELLSLSIEHRLDVLAVLNEGREVIGTVPVPELIKQFATELGVQEAGAVLILRLDERDYSLTEISRLIESNGLKIISSYFSNAEYGTVNPSRLTLKLNRREVGAVVSTLERFGYQVETAYAHTPIENTDQERLDSLLRYLNT
jgi:acetoin utilization protein AcuB